LIDRKQIENWEDDQLVDSFKKSDQLDHLGVLYQRYTHLIFGTCMKYLKDPEKAKDAHMAIFEKLIVQLKKYEVTNFKSWLYVLTKNHCLMDLRKKKKNPYTDEISELEIQDFSPLDQVLKELQEKKETLLDQALNELKEKQKIAIKLFYFDGLSYDQIAKKTGESKKSVKSSIQNAKRNLKIKLEKHHVFEQ